MFGRRRLLAAGSVLAGLLFTAAAVPNPVLATPADPVTASGELYPAPDHYPAPQQPDPSYVFSEIGQLFSGSAVDAMTPGQVEYFIKAGILTNAKLLAQPFADLAKPETWRTPEGAAPAAAAAQKIADALIHLPPFGLTAPPHPAYLPDWNHDGVFGVTPGSLDDVADANLDDDFDDPQASWAHFRLPCNNSDGSVWFETSDGTCAPGDSGADFKLGIVKKFRMVNSRGVSLAGKAFFPAGVDPDHPDANTKFPVTVGLPGAAETANDVGMYSEAAARDGYVSFVVSQAGQPASDGNLTDIWMDAPLQLPNCGWASGSCLDAQDAVRWVHGDDITPIVDLHNEVANLLNGKAPRLIRLDPAYTPVGVNQLNPWLSMLDLDHINLWGQSIGSIGTSNYLDYQAMGHGWDGRPLPHVSAFAGMSGFTQHPASAAVMYQTADFDFPGLNQYGVVFPNALFQSTDGPIGTKDLYDMERRDPRSTNPMMFITDEGGFHTDSINLLGIPHAAPAPALSVHYAMDWFDCYGRADVRQAACDGLRKPYPGLSRAVATEYAPDGHNGPSYCVTIPDRATLEQVLRPQIFMQNLTGPSWYDCTPQQ
ncbi:hypothetical protein GPX89_08155 [Nocardia sp. ET3-3]|uniref:Uncharacterized protein n=1 Tax=Nocardia terrae TaxID=2675851 RepID=A0A7K1UST4_9NOCA|nr:hypothetical protein [Nocardia terrae]MVU77219.1 hypothetical protein [Nocardia terrae]